MDFLIELILLRRVPSDTFELSSFALLRLGQLVYLSISSFFNDIGYVRQTNTLAEQEQLHR